MADSKVLYDGNGIVVYETHGGREGRSWHYTLFFDPADGSWEIVETESVTRIVRPCDCVGLSRLDDTRFTCDNTRPSIFCPDCEADRIFD